MTQTTKSAFTIGRWIVEPSRNRVSSGDAATHLQPKTMEVLVHLADHAGDVVSAEDLINDVWDGRPLGDNPVYKAIASLRRAFEDGSSEQPVIETVPKRGYRLLLTPTPAGTNRFTATPRRWARMSLTALVGAVLGVAIAAAMFWPDNRRPPSLDAVSRFAGSHSQPSFAPDGESFAFVNDTDGGLQIWVLDAGQATPRQLTTGERSARRPRWSPDGQSLLFARAGNILSIPAQGGDATELLRDAYNPNWSRAGDKIVFERRYEVWIADADGSNQMRVDAVPRREIALAERWPAFDPDGASLVYFEGGETPLGDLWTVSLLDGGRRQLTFAPSFGSAPVWSPDGSEIIYSSLRGGSRTLWRVDSATRESSSLLTGSGDDDFPDISPDGQRIIYSNSRERFAIVKSDPRRDAHETLHESRQFLIGPELSPDHETIVVFGAATTGNVQLLTIPIDGGPVDYLTSDSLATHAIPRWSADGDSLYFFHTKDGDRYSRVPASGGNAETVVEGWTWSVANGAALDPTGQRIIYSRLAGQAPVQTMIRDVANASDKTFYATLEYPRWSRDGTRVLGSLFEDGSFPGDVAVCPVTGSECRIIAPDARVPRFSNDEREVYFVRGFGLSQELYVASAEGDPSEQHMMRMAPLFPLGPFYSVTPDGKVLWIRHDKQPGEIWIAER